LFDQLMEDIKTVFNDCDGIERDCHGEALVIEIVRASRSGRPDRGASSRSGA
jgi:hypothetical protein